jgi:hypothetical protein
VVWFGVKTRDSSVVSAFMPALPNQLSGQVSGGRHRLRLLRGGLKARVVVGVVDVVGECVDEFIDLARCGHVSVDSRFDDQGILSSTGYLPASDPLPIMAFSRLEKLLPSAGREEFDDER